MHADAHDADNRANRINLLRSGQSQRFSDALKERPGKPDKQSGADESATGQQLKIVVVRLLGRQDAVGIMIQRDLGPVSAEPGAGDGMRAEHL